MERTLWVLALAVLAGLVFYGMRKGWLKQARRQRASLPEFPEPPQAVSSSPEHSDSRLLAPATGFYVGTTRAADWQDRIVIGDIGHRAEATAVLYDSGLLVERTGASPLWIPEESLLDVRLDHKLANKVVPGVGMLVVTWQLGDQRLDTGFRGDEKAAQNEWVDAVRALIPAGRDGEPEGDKTAATRQEEQG